MEDGISGVYCDHPGKFGAGARALLPDRRKLMRIRRNHIEFWVGSTSFQRWDDSIGSTSGTRFWGSRKNQQDRAGIPSLCFACA